MAFVNLLYGALAVVMAGLGLSLTLGDFRQLRSLKRGVATALVVQMVVLPLIAWGIVAALGMPPAFAIGMMLLAATPGSISANLYSHLFGGNVAFNISLTGLNTFLCAFTLPLVCGWALAEFGKNVDSVPAQYKKMGETLVLVLVPVVIGMLVRARLPRVADRLSGPMKIFSALLVVVFSAAALAKEWAALVAGLADVGIGVVTLNIASLLVGYGAAVAMRLRRQEVATIAFQCSIHNAILALYIALSVFDQPLVALPAAIYSITMNVFGIAFGFGLRYHRSTAALTPSGNATPLPAR